jgi:hypothetical protein
MGSAPRATVNLYKLSVVDAVRLVSVHIWRLCWPTRSSRRVLSVIRQKRGGNYHSEVDSSFHQANEALVVAGNCDSPSKGSQPLAPMSSVGYHWSRDTWRRRMEFP